MIFQVRIWVVKIFVYTWEQYILRECLILFNELAVKLFSVVSSAPLFDLRMSTLAQTKGIVISSKNLSGNIFNDTSSPA